MGALEHHPPAGHLHLCHVPGTASLFGTGNSVQISAIIMFVAFTTELKKNTVFLIKRMVSTVSKDGQ